MGQPVLDKKALMRDKRAQGMAAMGLVVREGDKFRVTTPALRGRRASYEVWRDEAGKVRCTCLEFEEESANDPRFRCEHILAVKHAVLAKNVERLGDVVAETAAGPTQLDPLPPPPEHVLPSAVLPWEVAPLDAWAIVGMNHYFIGGVKHLYIAMMSGCRAIKAEGPAADALKIFDELRARAEAPDAEGT